MASIVIIKKIPWRGNNSFKNVEIFINCIITVAIKILVQSVLESLISRFKKHFHSSRQMADEHPTGNSYISTFWKI